MNSDLNEGYYVLQVYASAVGVSPATVTQNFLAQYSTDELTLVGKMAQGIQFDVFKSVVVDTESGAAASDSPTYASLSTALLQAGGTTPPVSTIVEQGVAASVSQVEAGAAAVGSAALSGLKYVAIIAVIAAGAYLLFMTGGIRSVIPKRS